MKLYMVYELTQYESSHSEEQYKKPVLFYICRNIFLLNNTPNCSIKKKQNVKNRSIVYNPIQKLQAYAYFKNHTQFVAIKIRNIMKKNNNMIY